MSKKKIKKSIIDDLKYFGCSSYQDLQEEELSESDWYDIAEAVGSSVIYDPYGMSYTLEEFSDCFKLARYEKD